MNRIRRLLPRSLFGRALLIVMVPMVLLQVVSAFVFYNRHWEDIARRLTLGLAGDIAIIIDALHDHPNGPEGQWLLRRARRNFSMDATFEPGAALPEQPPHRAFGPIDWALLRVLPEHIDYPFQFDTSDAERVKIEIALPDGLLRVVVPRKRLFSSTTYVFFGWMTGTSLILLLFAIYLLRRQIRPIRRLAHAADSFGKGVQVVDFKPEGAREVRQAANAFLRMRARIQRQISQRTEMLAGVSHDLRTPLTRMKLQLAMLPDGDATRDLRTDVGEMEKMVEGYLSFARGEGAEVPVPTRLDEVLGEVVTSARRKGATIELHCAPGLVLTLRRHAVRRALTNLIDNAARHGSRILVSATTDDDLVEITIDDDGPGIPPEQRESVFKPFHRLDQSRNLETGGIGLGLTIARDVIRNHGGEVVLGPAPMGGLRACVRLPV
ncbi:MAG: ATP-binding protein [Alphaproteobacteria bacterium]|jgi:two-component system osmolarity sensor histidine kinase EnvZ|nr:ATP-binding protein [Alphaproteobacteria bacterium]MDP6518085.1 ATP-binding protein [Alphaproteobacteria bacterium]